MSLETRERPRAHVVDLDQAPRARLHDDGDQENRVHLHLAKHEQLGGIGTGIVGRDRARNVRFEDCRGGRIVRQVVAEATSDLPIRHRVVGDLTEQTVLEARDEARLRAQHERQLAACDSQHPLRHLFSCNRT